MVDHAHWPEEIHIEHSLHSGDIRVDSRHSVSYTRAVHEDIKMSIRETLYAGLQILDGLVDGHVEGKESDPGPGKMVTGLLRKHRGDCMKTAASVLEDQCFADSSLAATVSESVSVCIDSNSM